MNTFRRIFGFNNKKAAAAGTSLSHWCTWNRVVWRWLCHIIDGWYLQLHGYSLIYTLTHSFTHWYLLVHFIIRLFVTNYLLIYLIFMDIIYLDCFLVTYLLTRLRRCQYDSSPSAQKCKFKWRHKCNCKCGS